VKEIKIGGIYKTRCFTYKLIGVEVACGDMF
jgi:hypothetical protein